MAVRAAKRAGRPEVRGQRGREVSLGQFVGEIGLHLARREALAGQELRELLFAELAGHPVERDRDLLDLGVDQRRAGNDAGAGQHFGLGLVESDLVQQLLVEAVLDQEFVGEGLLGTAPRSVCFCCSKIFRSRAP